KLGAGPFVLRVDVVPPAKRDRRNHDHRNDSSHQFRLVFRGPVGSVLRRLERDLAEAVLLQLMPGFCAHGLPSSLKYRLAILQSNRVISRASKAGTGKYEY